MKANHGRHRIWMRAISTAVVCLFLANDIVWANAEALQSAKSTMLARWLVTRSLTEAGVDDPGNVELEAGLGIASLAKGAGMRTVNAKLREAAAKRGAGPNIEFLSCGLRDNGTMIAHFCLAKDRTAIFKISHGATGEIAIVRAGPRDESEAIVSSYRSVKTAVDSGRLMQLMPEWADIIGVGQTGPHTFTVDKHILRTIELAASNDPRLNRILLLHDIGKKRRFKQENNDARAMGLMVRMRGMLSRLRRPSQRGNTDTHAALSAVKAQILLDRLEYPSDIIERDVWLIQWHPAISCLSLMGFFNFTGVDPIAWSRELESEEEVRLLSAVALADMGAKSPDPGDHLTNERRQRIEDITALLIKVVNSAKNSDARLEGEKELDRYLKGIRSACQACFIADLSNNNMSVKRGAINDAKRLIADPGKVGLSTEHIAALSAAVAQAENAVGRHGLVNNTINIERMLSVGHALEKQLLAKSVEYLDATPVNEHIDISAIPQDAEQLQQNMKTLARLVAWNNSFGLNIRYILDNDTDGKARGIVRAELAALATISGINSEELVSRVGTLHAGGGVIDIHLATVENIGKMGWLADRVYAVALRDNPELPGVSIPNYTAASAIGLALAALRTAKDKEGGDGYESVRRKVFDIISTIYKRFRIIHDDQEFTVDDLEFMVSGCSANKLKYAILYALPPIVKDLVERLQKYHESLHLILQAA